MKQTLFSIVAFCLCFSVSATPPSLSANAIDLANGGLGFMRHMLSDECLPFNGAKESELENGTISETFFVPNQLGYWMMNAVLSVEARALHPALTYGFTTTELLDLLPCMLDKLEFMQENASYVDPQSGKIALFQTYDSFTGEALGSEFDRIVSMLDNAYLITALRLTANWLEDKDANLHNQAESILDQFDMDIWIDDDSLYLGGTNDPLVQPVDRIISESRLALVVALARGEMSPSLFSKILRYIQNDSVGNGSVAYLPFYGTALEIWVATALLPIELNTKLGCEIPPTTSK